MKISVRSKVACVGVLLLAASLAGAKDPGTDSTRGPDGRVQEVKERRREGTKFEGAGRFEITGDRVVFHPAEGQESFRVLENLALERVSRVLGESREPRQWSVAGEFTEFQGANYVSITRATVKLPTAKESTRPEQTGTRDLPR